MEENKDTVVIDDKKLKQTKGGAANWISITGGQIVQCNADCYGQKADRCNVKNSGCCGYNH